MQVAKVKCFGLPIRLGTFAAGGFYCVSEGCGELSSRVLSYLVQGRFSGSGLYTHRIAGQNLKRFLSVIRASKDCSLTSVTFTRWSLATTEAHKKRADY